MCDSLKTVISDSNKKDSSSDDLPQSPEDGPAINEDRVSTETNVEQLRLWEEQLDWEQYDLVGKIQDRIRELESVGETVPETIETTETTPITITAPKKLSAEVTAPTVPPELSVLAKHQIKKFCTLCAEDEVDVFRIVKEIDGASTSKPCLKAGFLAFMAGMPLQQVLQLTQCFDSLLACTRDDINLDQVLGLVDEGLLMVSRITYADNTLVAGSVYVFSFAILPSIRLIPEWHVHWGSRKRVRAASFKNVSDRTKTGQNVRTVTDTVTNAKLQSCISQQGLWGP